MGAVLPLDPVLPQITLIVNVLSINNILPQVEDWMSWLPVVFGSLGAFGGGFMSDRISRNRGPSGRLIVLTSCVVNIAFTESRSAT